ncbi:MAG TPA: Eco57I restriction-modification methylase domain-containing protein [Chthoniobacterales bacterium]
MTSLVAREKQSALGQFFTSEEIADFIASLVQEIPSEIRLLDAGAGAGALTAAFVRRCLIRHPQPGSIQATAWEIDSEVLPLLEKTLSACAADCKMADIPASFQIRNTDFVAETTARLGDLFAEKQEGGYDIAVLNPPYRKIHSESAERKTLQSIGIEATNLYTAFVSLALRLLRPGGQLVAITPRSFCNGPYFRSFRHELLSESALRQIHIFDSRRAAFRKDRVLQENIIFAVVKGSPQFVRVRITSSSGEAGAPVEELDVAFEEIVNPDDPQRFIHIPSARNGSEAKSRLAGLPESLASLGLGISTGPVVDFRLRDALRPQPEEGAVPLLYPCHLHRGGVQWPKAVSRKPNAILSSDLTRRWLLPRGTYVLTKRFTSKEERRRVVACVLDAEAIPSDFVGIENHLNYFHAGGRGLDRELALGLFAFLNSTTVDQYFRVFSGHTQVNATDLRKLNYPSRESLIALGRGVSRLDCTQEEIDALVDSHIYARSETRQEQSIT